MRTSTHLIQIAFYFRDFPVFLHFFHVYCRILAVRHPQVRSTSAKKW